MFSNKFGVGVLKHPGYNGKGGGGGTTSTGTTYTTNIPEYAQPYVESMLGATQKQLFNLDNNNQITGFKGYTPYSSNMNDYIAGFSPLQRQAQQNVANMQMPGQYGMANQMAGASGLGSMGIAGQAANAGNQFQQQATNPYAVQQYMNPYLQASLDPQIDAIRRQYGITGQQQQSQATQAGAFGGSREALMNAENNRAMNSGINNAITQGYNQAFNNAQQQQQFGANLGLQGLQGALSGLGQAGQAASTLGQLGGQEQTAQQNIINAQNTFGQQQQAQEQQKINQAIQDYATAQQYPMMQLGMMSNMLRGLPMQGVTTQSYQAQPNLISQGIGAAGAGYALQNALGSSTTTKAAGGQIKSYAKGGIASYDIGGEVEHDLYDYTPDKLREIAQTSQSETVRNKARAILREKTSYAPGGIVAFSEGDQVEENKKQIEEDRAALKKLGYGYARLPAGIADILGGGYNAVASGADAVSNAIGIPRAGRALGIYDPEVTSVALPKIGSGSITPGQDYISQKINAINNPQQAAPVAKSGKTEDQLRQERTAAFLKADADKNEPILRAAQEEAKKKQADASQEQKPVPAKEAKPAKPYDPNAQPAPSAAYMPSETTTAQGIIAGMSPEAQKYLKEGPEKYNEADYLKRKEAFLGPDTAGIEYRKQIMAERANAADEAKRQESLRMAEFFATWGSTPGPTLVAAMQAVQKTIPNIIADKKDQKKAKQESDKIIHDLDNAARLEKAGNWEEAQKRKEEASKKMQDWYKTHSEIAVKAAENKTRLEQEAMQGKTSRDVATIGANASMANAAESAKTRETGTKTNLALKADSNYQDIEKQVQQEKAAPKGEYQKALATISTTAALAKKDPNSTSASMYKAAQETIKNLDEDHANRLKSADRIRKAYWKDVGFNGGESDNSSKADPLNLR